MSAALKRGLLTARDALRSQGAASSFEIYKSIDLGPGGYARAPARRAKTAVFHLLDPGSRGAAAVQEFIEAGGRFSRIFDRGGRRFVAAAPPLRGADRAAPSKKTDHLW